MGWYRKSATWGFTIIFITIVALMMYAVLAYALWHVISGRWKNRSSAWVDPSDPVHLIMVSSTRDPNDDEDALDALLDGFESDGLRKNEDLRVKLTDVRQEQQNHKQKEKHRFKVTKNQVWPTCDRNICH
jgi:hypothetical protein